MLLTLFILSALLNYWFYRKNKILKKENKNILTILQNTEHAIKDRGCVFLKAGQVMKIGRYYIHNGNSNEVRVIMPEPPNCTWGMTEDDLVDEGLALPKRKRGRPRKYF